MLLIRTVHTHDLRRILTTIRTPRCPEVEHHRLALGPLCKLELLPVRRLHLEVRSGCARLNQFRCILAVHVLLRTELRFHFYRCSNQE